MSIIKGRRYLVSVMCILFALFVAISPMQAAALMREPPEDIKVTWQRPTEFVKLERKTRQAIVHTKAGSNEVKLYFSFPDEGGIRIHTEDTGYHESKGSGKISYKNIRSGVWQLTGENGTKLRLAHNSKSWAITAYNEQGERVYTLDARSIGLGFKNGNIEKVILEGGISEDEVIYGFGEQHQFFNAVGEHIYLWNDDSWSEHAYKNIPFFHSTDGYAIFFNSTYYAEADMGVTDPEVYKLEFRGPTFDFYLWTGDPLENLEYYTNLTGTQCLSPKWAFSYWGGGASQYWEKDGNVLESLNNLLTKYRELGTPNLSVIAGEDALWRDANSYNMLKLTGTKLLAWNMPFASQADIFYGVGTLSTDPIDYELPLFRSATNPWSYWTHYNYPIDHSHPNIKKWLKARWGTALEQGLKGMMLDYGELMYSDMLAYTGQTGADMHNLYGLYYYKAYDELFREYYPDGDYFLYGRAGFAGAQKYVAAFAADQPGTFEGGLKICIDAGLTISASGFSTWGSDVGGLSTTSSKEVYARWMQFGAFSPLWRVHGTGENNPWGFGEIGESVYKQHYWLRENLLDHIYSKSIIANKTGSPMMKALVMAYPEDKRLWEVNDEYLFCDDFLVCTVSDTNVRFREVKFPEGNWVSLWSGETYKGGTTANVEAPLSEIPVFIKEGAIIPVTVSAESLELTDTMLNKDTVSALLVTKAGDEDNTVVHWIDPETSVSYTSKAGNGINITSENGTANVVLAYGVTAQSITANGKKLERLDTLDGNTKAGFAVDSSKTVIRLPEGETVKSLEITEAKSGSENVAINAKVIDVSSGDKNGVENAFDGDNNTSWDFVNVRNAYAVIDLGKVEQLEKAVFKWDSFYSKTVNISVSENGTDWVEVGDYSGLLDATHRFDLGGVSARYVRIGGFTPAITGMCRLYECELYTVPPITELSTDNTLTPDKDDTVSDDTSSITESEDEEEDSTTIKRKKLRKKIINTFTESGWLFWVIIAVIVLVVIAGVIILIIILKKRKRKKEE